MRLDIDYAKELASSARKKPYESGREDLRILMNLAATAQETAVRTNDPQLTEIANEAWEGVSAAFRQYREDITAKTVRGELYPGTDFRKKALRYLACELDARKHNSLESLEAAAVIEVDELHRAWKTLADSLSRAEL